MHTISVKGQAIAVPSVEVGNARIVATGKLIRTAAVHDEEWLDAATLGDPERHLAPFGRSLKADIFSFTQRIPDTQPHYSYPLEWDNAAVVPITTYKDWWEKLSQESRRNVRIAAKKGVVTRRLDFDDQLVEGIAAIYNESPIRLGKRFWHYGKSFDTVKRDNSSYLDRSDFIGAFFEGQLIGFVKVVYVDKIGSIMQILSMIRHQDKRTTNALIAKALEVCEAKGMAYLMYCKYIYGANAQSQLTEFKRRNGFVKVDFPRYYVPLTLRGQLAIKFKVHRGVKQLLPPRLLGFALRIRAQYHSVRSADTRSPVAS